jgi:phage N-6-adenine-methyltransferase
MPENVDLIRYEAAKRALSEYRTVNEVKEVRNQAMAIQIYAKQAKDRGLECDAAEARLRSERRLGQLLKENPKSIGGRPNKTGAPSAPVSEVPTLAEQGVDKYLAKSARTSAEFPEKEFETILSDHRERLQAITLKSMKAHVSNNSGEAEWYTPPEFIAAARRTMGGIDLDPASAELPQQIVKAATYYTAETNGLDKAWSQRVWLNPPYGTDLIRKFIGKLIGHFEAGDVPEAVVLVNNATDTVWFQMLAEVASCICFPKGRIKYLDSTGAPAKTPLQGQSILYLGDNTDAFCEHFEKFGPIAHWERRHLETNRLGRAPGG